MVVEDFSNTAAQVVVVNDRNAACLLRKISEARLCVDQTVTTIGHIGFELRESATACIVGRRQPGILQPASVHRINDNRGSVRHIYKASDAIVHAT